MTAAPRILTGRQVAEIRQRLGLTQDRLAELLGATGEHRRIWMSAVERDVRHLDHAKANLLLAIAKGYEPVFSSPPPTEPLTLRQAEALWAAKHEGSATTLDVTKKTRSKGRGHGSGGGFRRMLAQLRDRGLLDAKNALTSDGWFALEQFELARGKSLDPQTVNKKTGRWP